VSELKDIPPEVVVIAVNGSPIYFKNKNTDHKIDIFLVPKATLEVSTDFISTILES